MESLQTTPLHTRERMSQPDQPPTTAEQLSRRPYGGVTGPTTTYVPEDPIQILDAEGNVRPGASPPDLSEDRLLEMYADIVLARRFDRRAVALQRQGRISTYAPMIGQEGAQVATGHALSDADWLLTTYRDHAAKFVHGLELASVLQSCAGHPDAYAIPDDVNLLPEYIPIATQIPQAMGIAWGNKLQDRTDSAVLCHFGDGATSAGNFHEGLNFAGVYDVPAVFVCNNNQWAISTPVERQTASATIAQKAIAYGFEGVRVDGMDPLAVYQVTREALRKAKAPHPDQPRPTLIESIQYRFGAHTTADDPSVYRDNDAAERWREKDPLDRLEGYLYGEGILEETVQERIESEADARVEAAIQEVEAYVAEPDDIFEHVYDSMPERLSRQREELRELRETYDDDAFEGVLE